MKKTIIILSLLFFCSPTSTIRQWYEGGWVCSEVKTTWYANLTVDSLFIQRVIADNGNIQSVSFSRGTLTEQRGYVSAYSPESINDSVYTVSISGNKDTLSIIYSSIRHVFVRQYE
jgi:hypothetical protein